MTRIRFEDLPSTNTPRNATNLNKLNNVVISSTEPTTGEEVWIQRGKNLFNINDLILGYVPSVTNGELVENASRATTEMIEIDNNVSYAWKSSNSQTYIFYYDANKNFLGFNQLTAGSSYQLSANTNWDQTKYIRIRIESPSNITNAQLEQNETTTTYEAYIDKKVYVKNTNGNYEEFYNESEMNKETYSTKEIRIGTWMEKPLYRKVIEYTNSVSIGQSNKTISVEIPHNIQNLDLITNYRISITGSTKYLFPNFIGSASTGTLKSLTGIKSYDETNLILTIINDNWSSRTWYFILEYTKTTD